MMSLTPDDLDNIQMRQEISTLKLKEEMTAVIIESFDKHYEKVHLPLKKKVDNHGRVFLLMQGAWLGVLAYLKYGGK